MLLTSIMAVLCAYGAFMALWAVFGGALGFPLITVKPEWLRCVYRGVSEDGRDSGGCNTDSRLR